MPFMPFMPERYVAELKERKGDGNYDKIYIKLQSYSCFYVKHKQWMQTKLYSAVQWPFS